MSTSHKGIARLKYNRPSLRRRARPPRRRTARGQDFSAANYAGALLLQHCVNCDTVQYPPAEICRHCLGNELLWRKTSTRGTILSAVSLHHSLWEYFKRRIANTPWPVATVKLDSGVVVFAHLDLASFKPEILTENLVGLTAQVFSHSDSSFN
jgi:uncharacterized OB-fold protein